ncbi:MAG: hypothetical protein AAGN82_13880 [Myxococcota bacterium]
MRILGPPDGHGVGHAQELTTTMMKSWVTDHRGVLLAAMAFGGATALATASGCGNGETVEVGPSPLRTETGFCEVLAEEVCNAEVLDRCYLSSDETREDDARRCVTAVQSSTFCNPEDRTYHPEPAEGCVDAYESVYRDGRIETGELEVIAAACDPVFNDGRVEGGSCEVDADCAAETGLECVGKPGGSQTCQIPVVITPGESCAASEEICEPTHFCGADDACVVRREVGEACEPTRPCEEGLACTEGTCVALAGNGSDCTDDAECDGGFCIRPPDNETGTCGSAAELASTNVYCAPFLP